MKKITLPVAALEVCDRVRVRKQRPQDGSDIVQEYAEAYECGLITEPLDVFQERGTERYIVADGEHRLLALRRAKIKETEVRLHQGDEVDALEFALASNSAHGLRRSKNDLAHAVGQLMGTPKLSDKYRTHGERSELLKISQRHFQRLLADWRASSSSSKSERKAKQEAQKSAERNTRKDFKAPNDDTMSSSKLPESQEKPETPRPGKPTLTPQQKHVAKQVRESVNSAWTAADEHAFKCLMTAWSRSTPASRARFCAEIDKQAAA